MTAPDDVRASQGRFLMTAGGTPLTRADHPLRARRRWPALQDHPLCERARHVPEPAAPLLELPVTSGVPARPTSAG